MSDLQKYLESYETNRLSVLRRALDMYGTAMNQHERDPGKQGLKNLAEVVDCFYGKNVEQTVNKRFQSYQQTIHLKVFTDEPFPVNTAADTSDEKVKKTLHSAEPENLEKATCVEIMVSEPFLMDKFSVDATHTDDKVEEKLCSVASKNLKKTTGAQIATDLMLEDMSDLDNDNQDDCGIKRSSDADYVNKDLAVEEVSSDCRRNNLADIGAPTAHVQVYALSSYTDIGSDHLSFSSGQKIKQKKPANEDGLAYGYIISNKFPRKKKYGFYPADRVAVKIPSKKRKLKNFFKKR